MSLSKANFGLLHIRARLTLLFVAIFGATLLLFSWLLYERFIRNHQNEFDAALYNYAVDVAYSVDVNLFGEITLTPNVLSQSEKVFPFALGDTYLQVRTISGKPIARSRSLGKDDLPLTPEERDMLISQKAIFRTVDAKEFLHHPANGKTYRVVDYFIDKPGPYDYVLQIAVPMILLEHEKSGLITFFAVAIPAVLILAALGGLFLSRRALAPVNAIIAKARGISARELSERVPVPAAQDEIRELADTLNGLLDRLEGAFRSQERFIADASHQLKTPLSILRGEIDLMKSRSRSSEEVAEFLESASQEVSYLSRMVEDLLVLARIDTGAAALSIQSVRLDETALEVVSRLEKLARAKDVRLSLNLKGGSESAFEVQGDPDLLRSMVENLVENAIKYSPSGQPVELEVADHGEFASVRVADRGPGLDPAIVPKIFNRFYRGESTRDKISGSGLGLSIASRIAEVHRGKIDVESAPGQGTAFLARIKKV